MALPLYANLREKFKDAHLVLMAPPSVLDVPCEFFDEKIPVETAAELKKRGFDRAITLRASVSSAFLLWRAGIPVREGFAEPLARFFLTHPTPWKGRKSKAHKQDLYLLLAPGTARVPAVASGERRGIVVAPGASITLREWPGFREFLVELRRRLPDERIRLVGSSRDSKFSAFVRRHPELRIEDLIGRTTIPELVQAIRESEVLVANDSGPAHLGASLAGTPTVVVYGPGDPAYIAPRGAPVLVVAPSVLCAPCESARCKAPLGYQICLKSISAVSVVDKTLDWLLSSRGYTSSP